MSPGVRRSSTDEGTILLLTLGLMAFLLLVVSTVVDVSAVFLARRDVTGSCDAAAVASAQTARRDRVYAGSTGDRLPLDPAAAAAAARQAVADTGGVTVAVDAADTTVHLTCSRAVRLPLPAGLGAVTVRADSDAATPLR